MRRRLPRLDADNNVKETLVVADEISFRAAADGEVRIAIRAGHAGTVAARVA